MDMPSRHFLLAASYAVSRAVACGCARPSRRGSPAGDLRSRVRGRCSCSLCAQSPRPRRSLSAPGLSASVRAVLKPFACIHARISRIRLPPTRRLCRSRRILQSGSSCASPARSGTTWHTRKPKTSVPSNATQCSTPGAAGKALAASGPSGCFAPPRLSRSNSWSCSAKAARVALALPADRDQGRPSSAPDALASVVDVAPEQLFEGQSMGLYVRDARQVLHRLG